MRDEMGAEPCTPQHLAGQDPLAVQISIGLHGLCQPLTALQCRLEIGMMDATQEGLETAVRDALSECTRLNEMVTAMQDKVLGPAGRRCSEER